MRTWDFVVDSFLQSGPLLTLAVIGVGLVLFALWPQERRSVAPPLTPAGRKMEEWRKRFEKTPSA